MRINYKNTALGFLEDPYKFPFYIPEYSNPLSLEQEKAFSRTIRDAVYNSKFKNDWSKNVRFVTMPFHDAYAKSASKIKSVVQDTEIEDVGTLIIPWKDHTQTIFYALSMNGRNGDEWSYECMIIIFTKSPHSEEFGLDLFVYFSRESADYYNKVWQGYVDSGRDMTWWIVYIMCFVVFFKYADVETKVTEPKNRRAKIGKEKYINETEVKVQILDCTWFTNLVVSGAFMVGDETGGFLRWQHYGPGNSLKRLIWISPFEKEGYTRKAKILNQ